MTPSAIEICRVWFGEVGIGEVGIRQSGIRQSGNRQSGFGEVGFDELGENPSYDTINSTVAEWGHVRKNFYL